MNNETITKIGTRMAHLINVVNIARAEGIVYGNPRQNELNGMFMLLKAAEIPFDIKYCDDAQDYLQIEKLIIAGHEFECSPQMF